jgi:hypothetical protein
VVSGGREVLPKLGAEGIGLFAARRVDDGRPALRIGEDAPHGIAPLGGGHLGHLDRDVGAAEAMDEAPLALQPELGGDVVLDDGSRGGSEPDDWRRPEQRQPLAEHPVLGAEVVPPLRDAVGFIHRDEHRLALGEHLGKTRNRQALGRDEKEIEPASQIVEANLPGRGAVASRMDALGAQPKLPQLGNLIFHEGDERRDHERRAASGQPGELVAEGFSCSSGHDEEDVLALHDRAADCFLIGAEGGEAEGFFEEDAQIRGSRTLPPRPPLPVHPSTPAPGEGETCWGRVGRLRLPGGGSSPRGGGGLALGGG